MKSKRFLPAVFLAALMAVGAPALAKKEVYNFKGGVKTRPDKGLTKSDLAPIKDEGGFASWTYTFMFYLDDKSSGMIQFTYWKMYVKTERGLYFAFSDKGDELTFRKAVYSDEETKWDQSGPKFTMGPHYWKGFYPTFDVHLDFPKEEGEPDMSADLAFKCRTPGWRPGEGPVHYEDPDGDWYDLVVMIPWAEIEGTVTIDGEQKKVKGWGYSDHNSQTVFPTTQSESLMALRSFSDDYAIHFLEYIAPEDFGKERTTWILIMKGNDIVYATDKWEYETGGFKTEKRRGYEYPTTMKIKIDQPDCKLTGDLKGVKYIGALDAMDNLPPFIRPVAEKFVSAPVFMRQNAVVDYHLVMPEKGIDAKFTAEGVHETTVVR